MTERAGPRLYFFLKKREIWHFGALDIPGIFFGIFGIRGILRILSSIGVLGILLGILCSFCIFGVFGIFGRDEWGVATVSVVASRRRASRRKAPRRARRDGGVGGWRARLRRRGGKIGHGRDAEGLVGMAAERPAAQPSIAASRRRGSRRRRDE